ncbi:MAG: response regulator transcription factor [Planctomycetes bacterium]|nr:response regulator transcription factor [Planctomycetota bacterium]MBI3836170.1 response regulator transcription factor [Planctomycetota bacterium]
MTQTTMGKSILIVEDEADMADILRFNLEKEGYRCRRAGDGTTAWAEIRKQAPDLVILDRMLPDGSGDEVASKMHGDPRTNFIPVLMLTAKAEDTDQLVGFALGASDYVTKPFNMKVLTARVGSLLRRPVSTPESEFITGGPITLDQSRFEVCVDGEVVALTTTEFRILKTLMAAEGRVLDRSRLIDLVLGPTVAVTDRTIDVHIAGLRKKLGSAKDWVQTVRGVGYTFRSP